MAGDLVSMREAIIEKLEETCLDLGIQVKIYSPYELYSGRYVDLIPNVLYNIEDGECVVRYGFSRKIYQKPPLTRVHSGIH